MKAANNIFLTLFSASLFSQVFCLDSSVSREGVQRKALVKSFDHFENTELQKPDDKAVNLARIELSIGVALTVAGVAATVFCPLPIQVAIALVSIGIAVYSNRDEIALQFQKLKKWSKIRWLEFRDKRPELGKHKIKGEEIDIKETRDIPLILYERNVQQFEADKDFLVTMEGVAFKIEINTTFQTRARNLTQFLRDHISEYKDEEAKRYKVNLKEFNEYKLQKTGYVYPEEVRTIVTATKNELEQKIKQERSKKYKSMETSRKPIFSKSKIRSVENVFGFNKKNSSAAVHTKIYQKPKPAAINEHHANNPSSNSHENYADWIPQFLALNLIAMTKNYYELVNEVCTQYILLVRMMPAYKLSGPAPKFCKQDFQDYEWLTQSEVIIIFSLPPYLRKPILLEREKTHRDSYVKLLQDRAKAYKVKHKFSKTEYNLFDENKYGKKAKKILHMVSSLDPYLDDALYRGEEEKPVIPEDEQNTEGLAEEAFNKTKLEQENRKKKMEENKSVFHKVHQKATDIWHNTWKLFGHKK